MAIQLLSRGNFFVCLFYLFLVGQGLLKY
uniref:Uncharacterized protein n=1 Tax=Anguilla anguilla TaxID=7936 RepID=A0A0E9SSI9_ANGAN